MDIPYEVLFETLVQQSEEGVCLLDAAGNYQRVNPTFCQIVGYSAAELQAINIHEMLPAAAAYFRDHATAPWHSTPQQIEWQRKDNTSFLATLHLYPIPHTGQIYTLGILRDITADHTHKLRVQTHLHQTETLQQTIEQLNRAPTLEAIYEVAVKGILNVLRANRSSVLLFESDNLAHFKAWQNLSPSYRAQVDGHCPWQKEQIDAKPVFYTDVITADVSDELKAAILDEGIRALLFVPLHGTEQLLGKFMVYFDAPHVWTDQELQLSQVIAQNLATVIARLQALEALQLVVTELRESEEKMRSLARLSQKLEQVRTQAEIAAALHEEIHTILGYQAVWIYLLDEDMIHARLLTSAGNNAAAKMDRSHIFRIEGDAYLEKVRDAERTIVIADAQTDPLTDKKQVAHFGNRTIVNVPLLLKHRLLGSLLTGTFGDEGIRVPTPVELDYLEALARHVAVVIDRVQFLQEREESAQAVQISNQQLQTALFQLKETQENMVQRERLAAVGQLAAGIAHDFNNIMAVIVLYSEMGLLMPDIPARFRDRLQTILHQARRATDLVEQILDFGRRAVLEPRPMDMLPFLKEQVKMLERTVPESIQLNLFYGTDEYIVQADPTRLQQAIMNLIINARDAMPNGGELKLSLTRQAFAAAKLCAVCQQPIVGEWVCLQLVDTGCGIAPTILSRIFEPFFTTKAAGQGSGLGLSQVAGIVDQHQGHITVESVVNRGTTFSVYLPALPVTPREERPIGAAALAHGNGETILLVEDDVMTREALAASLELLNYRVVAAANGQIALAILEQEGDAIRLVLSDLVMPEMGGQALFQAMRPRGLTQPVILLTGHPLESDLQNLQTHGLAGWMLKPPNLEKLARLLSEALQGEIIRADI